MKGAYVGFGLWVENLTTYTAYHAAWRWSPRFDHTSCPGIGTYTTTATVTKALCFCGYYYTPVQWFIMCGLTAAHEEEPYAWH